jgi:voltage-gated potassium channel
MTPLLRRLVWHARRVRTQVKGRFFGPLLIGLTVVLLLATVVVTVVEKGAKPKAFGPTLYWAITTILGQGDASYATGPAGWVTSWLLALFGVGILAVITGALVGFVVDFLLKEGQGMGAAGYEDHIVICGWNPTARELVEELRSDDYQARIVLVHEAERSPVGDGVYFVRGDPSNAADLERAGIREAKAAIVCPADGSDASDMHSILVLLALEDLAPQVRTIVEVNSPRHADHFRRTGVDEVLVTSRLASHLLARTALYPGLGELVTDIVSGGEGSELYRVGLPAAYHGLPVDEASARLRREHGATLLALARGGRTMVNPGADIRVEVDDEAVVIAESLGALAPLAAGRQSGKPGSPPGDEHPEVPQPARVEERLPAGDEAAHPQALHRIALPG